MAIPSRPGEGFNQAHRGPPTFQGVKAPHRTPHTATAETEVCRRDPARPCLPRAAAAAAATASGRRQADAPWGTSDAPDAICRQPDAQPTPGFCAGRGVTRTPTPASGRRMASGPPAAAAGPPAAPPCRLLLC